MSSVDWERIRGEYIAGGVSFRDLAKKHNLTKDAIARKAKAGDWAGARDRTATRVRQRTEQKIVTKQSNVAADNLDIAQRIRTKLLLRLEREIDNLPDLTGSDSHQSTTQRIRGENGQYTIKDMYRAYKLKDFTAAYKDLIGDMDMKGDPDDDKLNAYLEGMKHA